MRVFINKKMRKFLKYFEEFFLDNDEWVFVINIFLILRIL
jgi:hypothetical protein